MPLNPDSFAELGAAIEGIRPDVGVKIRRSIAGGLSGASVYLVECQLDGVRWTPLSRPKKCLP